MDAAVSVAFAPIATRPGEVILSYTLEVYCPTMEESNVLVSATLPVVDGVMPSPCVLTGLYNGEEHFVVVSGTNQYGDMSTDTEPDPENPVVPIMFTPHA